MSTRGARLPGEAGLRLRFAGHSHQLRGSAWLIVTVAANAVGGFAFWLVAARVTSTDDVGRAAALFTSLLFVNYLTSMGLPVAIARYAPDDRESSQALFEAALAVTAVTSIVGSVGVLVFLPDSVTDPLLKWGTPVGVVLFSAFAIGMAFAVLLEVRLMALRMWGWVFTRVALVGVVRLPFIFVNPIGDDALWLFVLVAGTPALSGFLGVVALGVRRIRALPADWRPAFRFAGVNYVSLLLIQGPTFALPLIVLVEVTPSQNAAFYVAWSIATVVFLIPHTLGQVLLVEGGKGGATLSHQVRLALELALLIMAALTIVTFLGADLVTTIYGESYAPAAEILPTLVGAGMAWAVTSIFLTKARVQEDASAIVAIALTMALAVLLPAILLVGDDGIEGAARAWLIGQVVAAAVAVLAAGRAAVRRGTLAVDAAWLAKDPVEAAPSGVGPRR